MNALTARRTERLIQGFVTGKVSRQEIEAHRDQIQADYDTKPLDAYEWALGNRDRGVTVFD